MDDRAPMFTADGLLAYMAEIFPQVAKLKLRLSTLTRGNLVLHWPTGDKHLRPGGTISGPAMMTLADTAAYFLVLANRGPVPLAVTTNLNIHFLRKPAPGPLVARARVLKMGSRLVVVDVEIGSEGKSEPVAQATVTYSVPPADNAQADNAQADNAQADNARADNARADNARLENN